MVFHIQTSSITVLSSCTTLVLSKVTKEIWKNTRTRLRFLYDDDESDYASLINKSRKSTVEVKRLRILVFKTLDDLNHYMKERTLSKN